MDIVEVANRAHELRVEATQLTHQGRFREALEKWREAIAMQGDEAEYLVLYAEACYRCKEWREGLRASELATSFSPHSAEAWGQCASAHGMLGDQEEYIRCLGRAEELGPNTPSTRFNRSLWLLLHGRYEEGWREYEWRFMNAQGRRTLKEPWNGEPLRPNNGERGQAGSDPVLFVWAEQGYGDTIQFVRFVRAAKERWGGRVVLEVQRELVSLLHGQDIGADEIVAANPSLSIPFQEFEHVSLMSLPYVLGIKDEAQFWSGAYLKAREPDESIRADVSDRLKIGVCWKGNGNHQCDDVRSIDQQAFFDAIVSRNEGVTFYSINPDATLPDCPNCVNPDLSSFAQTARVLYGLDLVITVDTAVAHLAGALGVPTFLLLRYATDWRWCLNHATTAPWYPSMRLFRQSEYVDGWGGVLAEVAGAVNEMNRFTSASRGRNGSVNRGGGVGWGELALPKSTFLRDGTSRMRNARSE